MLVCIILSLRSKRFCASWSRKLGREKKKKKKEGGRVGISHFLFSLSPSPSSNFCYRFNFRALKKQSYLSQLKRSIFICIALYTSPAWRRIVSASWGCRQNNAMAAFLPSFVGISLMWLMYWTLSAYRTRQMKTVKSLLACELWWKRKCRETAREEVMTLLISSLLYGAIFAAVLVGQGSILWRLIKRWLYKERVDSWWRYILHLLQHMPSLPC